MTMKNSSQPQNIRPKIMETARHLFQTNPGEREVKPGLS